MNRLKQFILNGLLITAVSLLMRTVGVSFNVYVSNRIGAVAMGLFTLISTVYGFAITLATSGIGLATTRLVAEALGTDDPGEKPGKSPGVLATARKCTVYALLFSVGAAILLYLLAPVIGERILEDSRTVRPLQLLAVTLPPISLSSVLSGYFTAVRRVHKNAITQILGQGIKIYTSILLLSLMADDTVEGACTAIVLGSVLAELGSFLLQWLLYALEKKKTNRAPLTGSEQKRIQKNLLSTALPVAFSAYVRSGLVTVEHMMIPKGLQKSGASRDVSLAAYGTVHSMVFPLVLFPAALSGSFGGLLVPEVAEAQSVGDTARITRMINRVFSCVMVYAIGTAGILLCFAHPMAAVIYPGTDAGKYIWMIAPLVPVMYLDTSVDSLLKGMGQQFYCMVVNIIDSFLSVVLVWLLLPRMGIMGYIVTVYFTETVNATLSITRLFMVTKIKVQWVRWLIIPLGGIVLATAATSLLVHMLDIAVNTPFRLATQIILCAAIYLVLIFVTKRNDEKKRKPTVQ